MPTKDNREPKSICACQWENLENGDPCLYRPYGTTTTARKRSAKARHQGHPPREPRAAGARRYYECLAVNPLENSRKVRQTLLRRSVRHPECPQKVLGQTPVSVSHQSCEGSRRHGLRTQNLEILQANIQTIRP
jgi:hypothetical protein